MALYVKDVGQDLLSTTNSLPIKFESYGRGNVMNVTLLCRLRKTAMREHTAGVKPLLNGTCSSKKGSNRKRNSVLIYKTSSSPCAARFWILSHTQSCALSKEAENKTKQSNYPYHPNIRTLTEPLASLRVK